MPRLFQQYSFEKVMVIIGGLPVVGASDGDDALTIERREDSFSLTTGAQGDSVATLNGDRSGLVTLNLLQTSPFNLVLAGLLAQAEAGLISTSFPFAMKDLSNLGDLAVAEHCVVQRPATKVLGKAHNQRQWVLLAGNLEMV